MSVICYWTGHVALLREIRNGNKILVGTPEENHTLNVDIDARIITKMEHNKNRMWTSYVA
jgi:hypothetical protein